jgi:AraC-like DNA-binding protein/response regulator of citrate/malate metabolism
MLEIRPGAIVLDYEPEHSKGWQMIRTLKMAPQTAGIPVLFFSLVEEKDQGSIMSLDYFVKPIEIEKLTRALSRHGFLGQDLQGGKTILIVEDEAEILKLNVRAVHEQIPNCKVLQARNGKEALVIMETEIPNLVLLDLMMPELDGFGVLEAMQMNKALRHVPVIVLTAQHLDENLMAKLNRGVTAVLGKGIFTIDETLAHIDQALARSKPLGFETQQIVRSAMAFVHEHFGREITQEDIASAIGVSGRHLTRCFKDELDLSPMTYLRRYRIQQARTMLEIEDSTVSEIAFAVGFSNSSHFGRVFRREVGVSPSIYRDFGDSSSKNTK